MTTPNSDTHLFLTIIFGVFAIIIGVLMACMVGISHTTIPWWVPLCEIVLGYVTYSNYRWYKQSRETTQQTILPEDTQEIETRNIIQITSSPHQLFALCSDGTLWSNRNPGVADWKKITGIPK